MKDGSATHRKRLMGFLLISSSLPSWHLKSSNADEETADAALHSVAQPTLLAFESHHDRLSC